MVTINIDTRVNSKEAKTDSLLNSLQGCRYTYPSPVPEALKLESTATASTGAGGGKCYQG